MSRPRSVSLALAGALVAALAFGAPAVANAVTGWITQQLTFDTHDRANASVSGNRVVWQSSDGAGINVYTWKWGDASPSQLTTGTEYNVNPRVSGDRVVWLGTVDGLYQVFTIKVGVDATPTQLTSGAFEAENAEVSGDRVVWRASDGASFKIRTRKMGVDATATVLDSRNRTQSEPQVSGDRVVWLGKDGVFPQVCTWKQGDPGVTDVTSDANAHYIPHVSGERIVWEATVAGNNHIFTRKMGTDPAPVQLTTATDPKDDPRVSGDRVAWTGFSGAGLGQVFTRKVGVDTTPKTVSLQLSNMSPLELSGDRAVWSNYDIVSSIPRVYTRRIGADSTATVLATGGAAQGAMVSGDRVVWIQYGIDFGYHQVWFAKRVTKPAISRSPNVSTITVKRKKGVAKYTLSATFKDADGTLMAGKTVYLQTSSNGSTRWKNTYKLKTSASGKVSKALNWRTKGTRYYRWYSPSSTGYLSTNAARQKVLVR